MCQLIIFSAAIAAIIPLSILAYNNLTRCNRDAHILWQQHERITEYKTIATFAYIVDTTVYKCNITYNPVLRHVPEKIYYSETQSARCCTQKRGNYTIGLAAVVIDAIIGYATIAFIIYIIANRCNNRQPEIEKDMRLIMAQVELSSQNIALAIHEKRGDHVIVLHPA